MSDKPTEIEIPRMCATCLNFNVGHANCHMGMSHQFGESADTSCIGWCRRSSYPEGYLEALNKLNITRTYGW